MTARPRPFGLQASPLDASILRRFLDSKVSLSSKSKSLHRQPQLVSAAVVPQRRRRAKRTRRIAVVGFMAVGKTTLLSQFVGAESTRPLGAYAPTIENTFHRVLKLKGHGEFHFEFLDTAGQDEFHIMGTRYTANVDGYVFVYSIANAKSFEMVRVIHDKLENFLGSTNFPKVLVANKMDLESDRRVALEQGLVLATEWGCPFVEASATQKQTIDMVFKLMLREVEVAGGSAAAERSACACM